MIDFIQAVIDDIAERDHRFFMLDRGETLSDEICAQMEADGYEFACSPAADKSGRRLVYFTREHAPAPRM